MKIDTRDFGSLEISEREIVRFVQPVYGFEQSLRYALLSDDGVGDCFLWLQSTTQQEVCFILVDPAVLPHPYHPALPQETRVQLQLDDDSQLAVRLIAVVPEDIAKATVNLKSPVVINTAKKLAAQVMLDGDYAIRAPLVGGEGALC